MDIFVREHDAARCVKSCCRQYISGSGTDYNRVQGNFIGVDQSGNVALGNGAFGVRILSGAQFNVIGVDSTNNVADGNVISGNANGGVAITSSNDNVVAGNLIGLGADGSTTVGNGPDGGSVSGITRVAIPSVARRPPPGT